MIWNFPKYKITCNLPGHRKSVYYFSCNKRETVLASASPDETIRIWDISKFPDNDSFKPSNLNESYVR